MEQDNIHNTISAPSPSDKIYSFDSLFTNNHIQILKILMYYSDSKTNKTLAPFIKYLEFSHTIQHFKKKSYGICSCEDQKKDIDISNLCNEIKGYCTNDEKQKLEQIQTMFSSMKMIQEMTQTMDLFKNMSNQNSDSSSESSAFNPMDMLMGILTPEQQSMFEMFNSMQGDSNE
ncbi:MAG TPA: hypothetical protein VJZ04_11775 [Lachnospiraceae bacterium]|nr:hypothetical protein [Lachnospiraceae bacterium]